MERAMGLDDDLFGFEKKTLMIMTNDIQSCQKSDSELKLLVESWNELKFFYWSRVTASELVTVKNSWFGFGCGDFDNEAFTFE
jgi:hypothetical protein